MAHQLLYDATRPGFARCRGDAWAYQQAWRAVHDGCPTAIQQQFFEQEAKRQWLRHLAEEEGVAANDAEIAQVAKG